MWVCFRASGECFTGEGVHALGGRKAFATCTFGDWVRKRENGLLFTCAKMHGKLTCFPFLVQSAFSGPFTERGKKILIIFWLLDSIFFRFFQPKNDLFDLSAAAGGRNVFFGLFWEKVSFCLLGHNNRPGPPSDARPVVNPNSYL